VKVGMCVRVVDERIPATEDREVVCRWCEMLLDGETVEPCVLADDCFYITTSSVQHLHRGGERQKATSCQPRLCVTSSSEHNDELSHVGSFCMILSFLLGVTGVFPGERIVWHDARLEGKQYRVTCCKHGGRRLRLSITVSPVPCTADYVSNSIMPCAIAAGCHDVFGLSRLVLTECQR